MMKLFKVMDIKEVISIIKESFPQSEEEEVVQLSGALGRVLSEDIRSEQRIPGFRRSSVDGYAIKASAAAGASEAMPAIFSLIGEVKMGEAALRPLGAIDQCIYVATGAMVPEGADSIVMIEYSEKLDEETILINKSSYPGENLIGEDEDIALGELVLSKGRRLRPYDIAVLASLGIREVKAFKKIRCGIISTGDELVPTDVTPALGQVRDINTYMLSTLIEEAGAEPVVYGIVKDDFNQLKSTIALAKEQCQIVLISGGSSVGKKDETLGAIEALKGSEILVQGVAIKPGKPTIIAKADNKMIVGLPGHPLACAVVFKGIIKEYIDMKYSTQSEEFPISCRFSINYHSAKGREEFVPVKLEYHQGELRAVPIITKSGIMSSFSKATGYIRIDKNLEGISEGERVLVYKF